MGHDWSRHYGECVWVEAISVRICAGGGPLVALPRIFPLLLCNLLVVWLLLCFTVHPPVSGASFLVMKDLRRVAPTHPNSNRKRSNLDCRRHIIVGRALPLRSEWGIPGIVSLSSLVYILYVGISLTPCRVYPSFGALSI